MGFRGDDPQYMHDEFISSSSSGGYQIACPVVPRRSKPIHCYAHQGHLRGLRQPCPFGDKCPCRHAKEKVSQADYEELKRTFGLYYEELKRTFGKAGLQLDGMSQSEWLDHGIHLAPDE